MTAYDIFQLTAVIIIIVICAVWLLRRITGHKRCDSCDSDSCPLRNSNKK